MKTERQCRLRWQALGSIFVVGVVVNYVWELAQAPLYVGHDRYNAAVFWHCFVASLGDGIMVLLIVAAGWITLKRLDWFERPGIAGYVVMLIAGLLLAVLVEWLGLHVLRRWQYSERMPLLPGLGVGIAPIAQMLFLPPLIFRTVLFLAREKYAKHSCLKKVLELFARLLRLSSHRGGD